MWTQDAQFASKQHCSYNYNVRLASGTAFCSGSKCTFSSGASYVLLMALLLVVVVKDFGTKWL